MYCKSGDNSYYVRCNKLSIGNAKAAEEQNFALLIVSKGHNRSRIQMSLAISFRVGG